jgi:N utilization substance protein A
MADALFEKGFFSAEELGRASVEDLVQIRGIGEEKAVALIQNAETYLVQKQQEAETAAENEHPEAETAEENDGPETKPDEENASEDKTVSETLENEKTEDTQEN